MKSGKSFLKEIDTYKFEVEAVRISESVSDTVSVDDLLESSNVEKYKRKSLLEFLDQNKDKLLALQTYTEGDPVVIDDAYEPHARKHGKVVSRGDVEGTVKVKFEDGEYDVPEHHITRKDAIANESVKDSEEPIKSKYHKDFGEKDSIEKQITEQKHHLAVMEDGCMHRVSVDKDDDMEKHINENYGEKCLAHFPEDYSEEDAKSVVSEEMTDEQMKKREEIVMAMKKNKDELKSRYGDKWESVLYAIATQQAMKSGKKD